MVDKNKGTPKKIPKPRVQPALPKAIVKKIDTTPPPPKIEQVQPILVGVLSAGDRHQAFILLNEKSLIVFEGDKFGVDFLLEKITFDSIQIKNFRTQSIQFIPLTGN